MPGLDLIDSSLKIQNESQYFSFNIAYPQVFQLFAKGYPFSRGPILRGQFGLLNPDDFTN